ncbi:MAG: C40 family peptidase [Thermoleophilia bacterium]|nr:C40 family peptidase [Thermoleophilia bacterium]
MRSLTALITAHRLRGTGSSAFLSATAALTLAACLTLAIALPASSGAATLAEKQARAATITGQVNKLDRDVDHLQELYRGAQIRLNDIDVTTKRLDGDLAETQQQLGVAQQRLIDRVISVYRTGGADNELINLARAGTFDKLFRRFDAIQRVSKQDARILGDIRTLRHQEAVQRAELKQARAEQAETVAVRKKAQLQMSARLAARTKVLGSVHAETRSLVAAEQARQAAAAAAAAKASAVGINVTAAAAAQATSGGKGAGASPASTPDAGTAIAAPVTAPAPSSGSGAGAASVAMGQIGVPYLWGGSTPAGFDCSGLVMYAFAQVGKSLPHSSYAQWGAGPHVSRSDLQVGDLVFFDGLGHVGIYVGGNSYVHAPNSHSAVSVDSLSRDWEQSHYVGATRVL